MGRGGYYLRFERPDLAQKYSPKAQFVTRARQEEWERSNGTHDDCWVDCLWVRNLRVDGLFVYVPGTSELDSELYGLQVAQVGESLFQRVCRAIAEETSIPFEGRCAYATQEGVLQSIEARFDQQVLTFAVLEANEKALCAQCAEGLVVAEALWWEEQEIEAVGNNHLALLQPAFSCEGEGCSVTVTMQQWEADPEWPYGGWMPFVHREVQDKTGFDQALMQRAQKLDYEACSNVAESWILAHANDEAVLASMVSDPRLGSSPDLMTSYVHGDLAWLRIARAIPQLQTIALAHTKGYSMVSNRDELLQMARRQNTPVAYAAVARMLRLLDIDVSDDITQGIICGFAERDPSPAEWDAMLRMHEPDRTKVLLALLDVDADGEWIRTKGLIDAVCAGRYTELDLDVLREGAQTNCQQRNLSFFESYFKGIHCTWK